MSGALDPADAARLEALHDIRPPPLTGAEMLGDALLAGGLGLGAVAGAMLLLGGWRGARTRPASLRAHLKAARGLPAGERLRRLAALAAERGVALPDALRTRLYAPGAEAEAAALGDEIETVLRGGGR